MSPELQEAIKNTNFGAHYHQEQNDKAFFESGWKAARDKIVEILRIETRNYEGWDEANSFEYIPERIISEIENL